MFEQFFNCEIIGLDTETGIRFSASDTSFINFSHTLPEQYHIKDYSDQLECYQQILKTAAYISSDTEIVKELRKTTDATALELYIRQYAVQALNPNDRLSDYELISKVTYPRYACIVGCSFETVKDFSKAENVFKSNKKSNFILKEHAEDFISMIIDKIENDQNFAIVTFNLEYDFNALMVNVKPTFLHEHKIIDERLPTKIHADKTITWRSENKECKGCCKWVDAMLLSEKGMSIKRYGELASSLYCKDYNKLESYDYDNIIYSSADLKPDKEELKYCYRDVQLAIWGLSYLLRNYVTTLNKCGLLQKPSDLPITCSHLYDMVNCINTLGLDLNRGITKRKKFFTSYKRNVAKDNELHYNPPDEMLYRYFKKAFGGGKITFNPLILEEKLKDGKGYSLDLCSAYPFQVVNRYPDLKNIYKINDEYFVKSLQTIKRIAEEISKGNFINTIPVFKYGFTAHIILKNVCIKKEMHLPLLGVNDGAAHVSKNCTMIRNRIMAADSIELYVTHIDLITILACYNVTDILLVDGYVYELKPMNTNLRRKFTEAANYKSGIKKFKKMSYEDFPFKDFNDFIGQGLLTGKETQAELEQKISDCYQNSKVLFNGIYGKACQSLIHSKKFIDDEGNISITMDKYKARQGTCYTTGRYIATYTRLHICMAYFIALKYLYPEDLILYMHTDSIKLFIRSGHENYIIQNILKDFNTGIDAEIECFLQTGLKSKNEKRQEEFKKTYAALKNNGLGYLENETEKEFCKAVVCGNMRILTEDMTGNCHITFSGINVPYVLSRGKNNYKPDKLKEFLRSQGIFKLYDDFFCSGKKYTMFESCKTALDYKHYNMLLSPELGHICQTIKEMPIEINGDKKTYQKDLDNIKWWRKYKNA